MRAATHARIINRYGKPASAASCVKMMAQRKMALAATENGGMWQRVSSRSAGGSKKQRRKQACAWLATTITARSSVSNSAHQA